MVVHRSSKSVESVRITHAALTPDGVIGNTSEFESDILSSSLSPVSLYVGFSLTGKVPHCECGEQGSSPGVNQEFFEENNEANCSAVISFCCVAHLYCKSLFNGLNAIRLGVMATYSFPFLSERQVVDECIQFKSEGRTNWLIV